MTKARTDAERLPAPAVVRGAAYLLWAAVALDVAAIAVLFVPTPELDRALEDFSRQHPELQAGGSGAMIETAFLIGLLSIFAVVLAVLAFVVASVRRGSQPARILTWVIGGVIMLSQCFGLIGVLMAPALLIGYVDRGNRDSELIAEQMKIVIDHTPGWLVALITAPNVLGMLAIAIAAILLAAPAANAYFRKRP